jgi:hypothetical protein
MPNIYKTTTYSEIHTRNVVKADTDTSNSINSTISNFITYFKEKHL